MNYTLKIIYMSDGTYSIFTEDGINPMEFIDKTESTGYKTLKDAIKVCVDHDYKFEII